MTVTADYLDISRVAMVGGHPALDFANTTSHRHGGAPRERLGDFADVVTWATRAGILDRGGAQALRAEVARSRAGRELARVIALREVIYRVFSAAAARRTPAAGDLDALTAAWRDSATARSLQWQGDRPLWRRDDSQACPTAILGPLADAAVALLFDPELARVKECVGDDCNWLFLDSSRNHSRRWCDMADCGNRAKVRRFYQKQREG
jgi:predicted RNA-binding Zn ribbon-like protein